MGEDYRKQLRRVTGHVIEKLQERLLKIKLENAIRE